MLLIERVKHVLIRSLMKQNKCKMLGSRGQPEGTVCVCMQHCRGKGGRNGEHGQAAGLAVGSGSHKTPGPQLMKS